MFSFPNPVDEISARLVAGGVVLMCVGAVALHQPWLIVVIAYGFLARVLTGPTLSPLGLLVTRVVRPRLNVAARPVPGPPKRFAQGIGALVSVTAAVLAFGSHRLGAAQVLLDLLAVAATLESVLGLCLGCVIFNRLARIGLVPAAVCAECNDISLRPAAVDRSDRG
ncbi:DUF4395 domain-containing protein [Krasilnikovia sp. M28-CT-15]|uniref:DUF4395 domain-containing protein n=1 Tax=Krasilnikovia sp. M28-CT-15 TaxID=3373540 RepID=UPI0038762ABA